MASEVLIGQDAEGRETRFRLEITQEGEHWTSTLARLSASGEPEAAPVAPRFYGLTAEQARRRMIAVLENQFEEVRSAS